MTRPMILVVLLVALVTAVFGATPGHELDRTVVEAIDRALADERRSEAVYAAVIDDHGEVRPFSRIVEAEGRHSMFLESLFEQHGLEIAEAELGDDLPHYASLTEACAASIDSERANVALYDELLTLDLPSDVRSTFEHNRLASLEHHLLAFERCADGRSGRHAAVDGPGRAGHGERRGEGRRSGPGNDDAGKDCCKKGRCQR